MTKDLAVAIHRTTRPPEGTFVTTDVFLNAIEACLKAKMA